MKFTMEVKTQPMNLDVLEGLVNLLQDNSLRIELESIIENHLENLLIHQGLKGVAVQVELS